MDDTAERIYLPRLPAFKENTYCVDQADNDTIEYIRADLHQKALDRIEALEAKVKRLRKKEVEEVIWRERHIEELEAKLVRYNEVVGDKINLRAEIAELKAENKRLREGMEWQPIETAPRDGTMIVVHNAILWLPLPELPSTQTEGEE